MPKLTVMSHAQYVALNVLGLCDQDGVPICEGCAEQIERLVTFEAVTNHAPIETLFCQDGNQIYCARCVTHRANLEIKRKRAALKVAQDIAEDIARTIFGLTGHNV